MLSNQAENQSHHETETEYSGVVNLAGHHLKRIECLPKGISPSTLLLSNNEISRVENLQYFVHLKQLSLAGNHIVDIKGISAAFNLRVLDLSNNSIAAIEGVSALRNLEWLNLSGNSIEKIENLDRNNNLYHLDLSDNSIAVISGLRTLKKLKTLLLHGNLLSSLSVIKDQVSTTLCILSLADNEISDLNEITHLSSLVNLEQLSLINNPCVLPNSAWRLEVNYRPYLVYCCDTLRNLDGHLVNNQERMIARLLDQAFSRIGHPTLGQHVQLVSILHHICTDPTPITQTTQEDAGDELDGDTLLESESFYLPVPSSDMEEETESDDAIMTEEEAIRLFSLAATIIQAHVRGYLVRKKFDFCRYRRRNYAAACIQAAWKGYCARTRDIKVVNIRNELRIRRLISLINNLYNTLKREHDDAVKSREQFKSAIKYLWYQVTEQKKLNEIQLHKEQVKAAIKIQAWWRGCMCKKVFPHKNVNKDKVTMLFSLCRSLQMQLDVVTSRINEITKGTKQSKESLPEEQTDSEGQSDQFYDTFGQLDSSQDTISPLRDSQINHSAARSSETTVQRIDAKLSASDVKSSEDTQGEKAGDLKALENNTPEPSQTESKEEFVGSDFHVPLHSNIAQTVPSLADQTEHRAHEMALTNLPDMEVGSSKEISSFDREECEKEAASSLDIGHTVRDDSDEKPSLDGAKDFETRDVTHSTYDKGDFQEPVRALSPIGQDEPRSETEAQELQSETEAEEPQSETEAREPHRETEARESQNETEAQEPQIDTEAHASGIQIDILDKDADLFEGLPTSIVVSEVSEPTDKATLQVPIPEIVVSSPVPTDDEGSDAGSSVESDANDDGRRRQQDSKTKEQNVAENQSDLDSTGKSQSSNQETESRKTEVDTFTVETKQKVDISKNLPESNLSFGSATVFSASEELSSEQPGTEVPADQSSSTVAQESVPNLGERASSLLSQLRSEIASMKTARLSGVTSDGDGNATDMSQLRDTSQPAVQERDTTEPTVKYHLPLFEDLDSACTSFSLDDFLNDPAFEENADSALETDNKYNGEEY